LQLQEADISFFFEHEATNHVLVMCDGNAAYVPISGESTVVFHREKREKREKRGRREKGTGEKGTHLFFV
jgi:uncharacterized protein involved in type VI secretion and phage assembly